LINSMRLLTLWAAAAEFNKQQQFCNLPGSHEETPRQVSSLNSSCRM
jgi:hypothetical protein